MNRCFKIMMPYRVVGKTNQQYSDDIRALVAYIRNKGIKVFDLLESDILDETDKPIEHIYLLDCYGNPNNLSNIFSNTTIGHYGETVIYA